MSLAIALAASVCFAASPPVATVVMFKGTVTVMSAQKKESALTLDTRLIETDTVKVGPGALAVLKLLKNDYLVRIDDELELAVHDIALLNAAKATKTLDQQLSTLVSPVEEKATNMRMAGWVSERHAAIVPAAGSETARALGSTARSDVALEDVATPKEAEQSTQERGEPSGSEVAKFKKERAEPPTPVDQSGSTPRRSAKVLADPPRPTEPSKDVGPLPPPPVKPHPELPIQVPVSPGSPPASQPLLPTEATLKACLTQSLTRVAQDHGLHFKGLVVKVKIRLREGQLRVVAPALGFPVHEADACLRGWSTPKELEVTLE